MSNVITPNIQILPQINLTDKTVTIEVSNLPTNLKIGDMILLETLMNSDSSVLIGGEKEQPVFNLLSDNQKIPLQIKENFLPKLSSELPSQLSAKVVSDKSIQLVLSESQTSQSEAVQPRTDVAIIKDINTGLSQIRILPLSGQQVTSQIMGELQLPQPIQDVITNLLPPAKLSLHIENLTSSDNAGQTILQPLKTAIQNLASAVISGNQAQISSGREQVLTAIQNLTTQKFMATPTINSESTTAPINNLDSPLGKLTLETPLKITSESRLELSVSDVKTEAKFPLPLETLQKIFERPEIRLLFPSADSKHLLSLLQNRDEAVTNLFKIFEPLQNTPRLAQPLLQKLPTLGDTMLSNMHSFYKGAVEQDINLWLGKETVSQLQSSGAEGKATLQNIQDFMLSSLRETPTWRVVEIPFFDGSQLIPLKLSVKKDLDDSPEENSKSKENGVRFLIDTEFSKLGAFQLDGFSVAKERRLDLVIRTSKLQSEDFCTHIINLFKTSLYNVDYIGSISVNQKQAFIKTDTTTNLPQGVFI